MARLGVQVTFAQIPEPGPAMGASSIFLCILFLGLGASPARGGLRCYTCGFASPCHPAPTACQDDEACGISVGTSGQNEVIERRGCLPRAQCPLPGRAAYRARAYTLQHHCCDRDLCNAAPAPPPSLRLCSLLLLLARCF